MILPVPKQAPKPVIAEMKPAITALVETKNKEKAVKKTQRGNEPKCHRRGGGGEPFQIKSQDGGAHEGGGASGDEERMPMKKGVQVVMGEGVLKDLKWMAWLIQSSLSLPHKNRP